MKILVVSDTHGRERNLERVLEKVAPVDALIIWEMQKGMRII